MSAKRKVEMVIEDKSRGLLDVCKHRGPACWPCVALDMERQRDEARAEIARLKVYEPRIKRLDVREGDDGGWEADIATRTTPEFREHFALSLAQIMVGANAPNYVEMSVVDPSDNRRFVVTIQRAEGKTPAQFRAEAEKERDAARAELLSARETLAMVAADPCRNGADGPACDDPGFHCAPDLWCAPCRARALSHSPACSECKAPCDPDGYCDPCAKAAEAKWAAEHGGKSPSEVFRLRKTAKAEAQEALNAAAAEAWIKRDKDSMILLGRALQANALVNPSPAVQALAIARSDPAPAPSTEGGR